MKESTIYPGEYVPSQEIETLLHGLQSTHKGYAAKPCVNMNETEDSIRIEVAVPGAKREDIFIYTHYNIISIMVLGNKVRKTCTCEQMHEFDTGSLERHILLPEMANTDFMCAEYRDGILYLTIPKTNEESAIIGRQVIVY